MMLRSRRTAIAVLVLLCAPCIADVAMWIALFRNPRLGFREELAWPLMAMYILSWISALVGALASIEFADRLSRKLLALFLFLFVGVMLLNVYGFFWGLGATVNAF